MKMDKFGYKIIVESIKIIDNISYYNFNDNFPSVNDIWKNCKTNEMIIINEELKILNAKTLIYSAVQVLNLGDELIFIKNEKI